MKKQYTRFKMGRKKCGPKGLGISANTLKKDYIDRYKHVHICGQCFETDPRCLVFHHNDNTHKSFEISSYRKYSLDEVINEIEKCVVLCANCHLKTHSEQGNKIKRDVIIPTFRHDDSIQNTEVLWTKEDKIKRYEYSELKDKTEGSHGK
jgi:hypothetical protein